MVEGLDDEGVCPHHDDRPISECGAFPCGNCGGDGLKAWRDVDGTWRKSKCGRCKGTGVQHPED